MEQREIDGCPAFLGHAALQLLDHKTDTRNEIATAVPAILSVLTDPKIRKTPIGDVLQRFLDWFEADAAQSHKVATSSGIVRCGWLRKISNSSFTTQRRWVVLDGSALMYYGDKSETDLKGVLQLKEASVSICKRTFHFNINSAGYAFELKPSAVEKPAPTLPPLSEEEGNVAPRGPATDATDAPSSDAPSTESAFGIDTPPKSSTTQESGKPAPRAARRSVATDTPAPAVVAAPTALNPLHETKRSYTWVCDSSEERQAWIDAISQAIAAASFEAECLSWARKFSTARSIGEYEATLRLLSNSTSSFSIAADWARVHMAASQRRGQAGFQLPRMSVLLQAPSLVRLPEEGSDGSMGARDAFLAAASPRNKKLLRSLIRHDNKAKVMRGAADKKETLVHKAEAAEQLREDAMTALASAEVSARRRREGKTPGDRVTVGQLLKDTQRDVMLLDGQALTGCDIVSLVLALSERIVYIVNRAFTALYSRRTASADAPPSVLLLSLHPVEGAKMGKQFQMQLMEFTRELLRCSSRTVIGGDTYDAIELVLQNPEFILLKPSTDCVTHPVRVTVDITNEGTSCLYAPTSSAMSPSEMSRMFSDSGSDAVLTPSHSDGVASPTTAMASHEPLMLVDKLPDVSCAADLLSHLHVHVQTRMQYSLVPLDYLPALETGEASDGLLATVFGTYSRTFPWSAAAPSARISLEVQLNDSG